jgi:SAM-dependent methyltransferase
VVLRYDCAVRRVFSLIALITLIALGACKPAPAPAPATPASTPTPEPEHTSYTAHHADHDFGDAAHWAARFDSPDRHAWQMPEAVIALLELRPRDRVADIGAGTGYFIAHLARAVPEGKVHALDVEPAMVEYMKQRAAREQLGNVEPRVVPADDPGLAEGAVDKILIVNTWHHIGDRARYAAALHRALAPCGSLLAIVDFTLDSPLGPPVAHRLAPEAVIAELRAAGFDAQLADEPLPHQYVVLARRPPPPGGCR